MKNNVLGLIVGVILFNINPGYTLDPEGLELSPRKKSSAVPRVRLQELEKTFQLEEKKSPIEEGETTTQLPVIVSQELLSPQEQKFSPGEKAERSKSPRRHRIESLDLPQEKINNSKKEKKESFKGEKSKSTQSIFSKAVSSADASPKKSRSEKLQKKSSPEKIISEKTNKKELSDWELSFLCSSLENFKSTRKRGVSSPAEKAISPEKIKCSEEHKNETAFGESNLVEDHDSNLITPLGIRPHSYENPSPLLRASFNESKKGFLTDSQGHQELSSDKKLVSPRPSRILPTKKKEDSSQAQIANNSVNKVKIWCASDDLENEEPIIYFKYCSDDFEADICFFKSVENPNLKGVALFVDPLNTWVYNRSYRIVEESDLVPDPISYETYKMTLATYMERCEDYKKLVKNNNTMTPFILNMQTAKPEVITREALYISMLPRDHVKKNSIKISLQHEQEIPIKRDDPLLVDILPEQKVTEDLIDI